MRLFWLSFVDQNFRWSIFCVLDDSRKMEINVVFNTWANKIVEYCVVKICHESRSVVSSCLGPRGLYSPWNSPGQNTRVGSLSLLEGIFPTQGSNPGLPHCGRTLYQLGHKGKISDLLVLRLLGSRVLPQEFLGRQTVCRK